RSGRKTRRPSLPLLPQRDTHQRGQPRPCLGSTGAGPLGDRTNRLRGQHRRCPAHRPTRPDGPRDHRRSPSGQLSRTDPHRPHRFSLPHPDAGTAAAVHLQFLHPRPGRLQPLLLHQGRHRQPHSGPGRRMVRKRSTHQPRTPPNTDAYTRLRRSTRGQPAQRRPRRPHLPRRPALRPDRPCHRCPTRGTGPLSGAHRSIEGGGPVKEYLARIGVNGPALTLLTVMALTFLLQLIEVARAQVLLFGTCTLVLYVAEVLVALRAQVLSKVLSRIRVGLTVRMLTRQVLTLTLFASVGM